MKLLKCSLFSIIFFGIIFFVYADISKLDEDISELNKALKELQSEQKDLLKESDKLAEKITEEKLKSHGKSNRKLNSLLRESQKLVSRLKNVSKQINETESRLKLKYSMIIKALVKELEKESNEKRKETMLKKLLGYMKESEKLKEPIKFEMPKTNLQIQKDDTPLEIREKADFLSDQSALLKAKMFQLQARINELEKDKLLREKVKDFADEIDFFDDSLFIEVDKVSQNPEIKKDGQTEETLTLRNISETQIDDGTQQSTAVRSITPDSSISDIILSGTIDEQIELLKQKKNNLEKQVQELLQKTQQFYKQADKLNTAKTE